MTAARRYGIAVAGAYLHGVGVPACVASGTAAAERVATAYIESTQR